MMYIYLLVVKNNHMFKIGKTEHPRTRIKILSKNFSYNIDSDFPYNPSWLIECCDYSTSCKIEKLLHEKFKDYNIRYLPKFDGSTEFFDINCHDSAVLFFINDKFDYIDEIKSMDEICSINDLPD